ncbi:MAG: LysR family transcriptional regulator [Polaromonas sp.]|nr:LysR family transcriptional regulator [Polaromonas sp.]
MKDLNALRVFTRVAQLKSFKEAGASLGLTASAVSKAITRLEAEVGVCLLQRTTRSVGLSDDGAVFFENCKHILGEIDQAENLLSRASTGAVGRLRIHLTEGLGRRVVMPMLRTFLDRYPGLSVSAELSNRTVDIPNEGFDVDIQFGPVADSRVVARALGRVNFVTCAAPAYLATRGAPQTPDDLARHNCLVYAHIHSGRLREWQFVDEGRARALVLHGSLQANNSEALLDAAVAGLGVVHVSRIVAREALAAGKVVPVLTAFHAPGREVHAVYLKAHTLAPKVRAFVDFLVDNDVVNRAQA